MAGIVDVFIHFDIIQLVLTWVYGYGLTTYTHGLEWTVPCIDLSVWIQFNDLYSWPWVNCSVYWPECMDTV